MYVGNELLYIIIMREYLYLGRVTVFLVGCPIARMSDMYGCLGYLLL